MKALTESSLRPPPEACGLYVHIPFCQTKCGYCDFFSIPLERLDPAPLVASLVRELEHRTTDNDLAVRTFFCGGGTPTVLPLPQLANLMTGLAKLAARFQPVEFTVEANPATVDNDKARVLSASGVNRVSLGAQSFFPAELATLERLHAPDDIASSVATLRKHGIQRINLDLVFGIPGQTVESWSRSLKAAIDLEVDHLACYGLTYEPGTRLTEQRNRRHIKPCDQQLEADMYMLAIDLCESAGLKQYETSNFARPGCECEHNLVYWHNNPYIGVGPAAVGCREGRRYKNIADVDEYIRMIDRKGDAEAESETLDNSALMTEMLMLQLRLVEGLSIEGFRLRTGSDPLALLASALDKLRQDGMISVSETHLSLTRMGRLVSDAVIAQLVSVLGGADPHLPIVERSSD